MAIRALPALLLILFLPHLLEAYEADYISSPEADYIDSPEAAYAGYSVEITITAEDARAFQSILNEVALRGAEAVQEKLSNSGQSVINQLIALHNQDASYAERKALMCPANKTYFSPTEVAQAFTQLRAIFSRDAMQQYQSWLSANPAHASDMRLWVWEKRSNDQTPAALTNADYYAQDPVMLETWRQDGCNNASLAEMGFFDAEDNAVELME